MAAAHVRSKVEVPELVEQRRAQIVAAAIELFGRQGYHVTTIREVAQKAQVSVGLIYQYVEDKEDVLFLALVEVLDSYMRELPAALAALSDPLERFCAAVRAYCAVIDRRIDATVLAYVETKSLRRERRDLIKLKEVQTNALIAQCIDHCIRTGTFEPIDVELLTHQIVMFCHAWALKAWRFRSRMSLDDYVERGLALMMNPVLTRDGQRRFERACTAGVAPVPASAAKPVPAKRAR
jgi:AcrR family transcriptional regulator